MRHCDGCTEGHRRRAPHVRRRSHRPGHRARARRLPPGAVACRDRRVRAGVAVGQRVDRVVERGSQMKKARLLSGALLLSLAAAGVTVAQQPEQYEEPGDLRPTMVLPAELLRGPYYQVQSPVVSDGYMLRFDVKSDYGPFEVTGTPALRKLVVEIGAIAKLREIKASKAFASAVMDSATGPLRFAKNLIVHPVDTTTGIPKGVYTW